MLIIAPLFKPGAQGWHVFSCWDSTFYERITTYGYDYLINQKELVFIVFFPLLPLLTRALMNLGLPFEVAGTLVNNLAFLGAAIVLYAWMSDRHGVGVARWTTSVLLWSPLSLFGTVIYAEGLYLLFSTAALRAFDKKQYTLTALWGALATSSRPTGIALIPALFLVTAIERRGIKAYIASIAAGSGLFLFSLYCQIKLGDPLAFLDQQKAWRPKLGFDWVHWWKMLMQIVVGSTNWKYGYIRDFLHPVLFVVIITSGFLLWLLSQKLSTRNIQYGFFGLGLSLWLLAGDPLTNIVMIFGGIYLLWLVRDTVSSITVVYGFCGITMLLASGGTISLNRLAYGIVSLSVALGLVLARHRRAGYAVICIFSIILASFAVRFAQGQWVA
ncbi:MAG: hypothetical protein KME33_21900 [Aetokthonos hydrillicola CCALA 1050]|nr:hypothetical protein [Aetokthonos hydrillicola CCALA 1050]MBW4587830.1 hypothetical protein [Aetokthonos hydrillicola CCALA 1050]